MLLWRGGLGVFEYTILSGASTAVVVIAQHVVSVPVFSRRFALTFPLLGTGSSRGSLGSTTTTNRLPLPCADLGRAKVLRRKMRRLAYM